MISIARVQRPIRRFVSPTWRFHFVVVLFQFTFLNAFTHLRQFYATDQWETGRIWSCFFWRSLSQTALPIQLLKLGLTCEPNGTGRCRDHFWFGVFGYVMLGEAEFASVNCNCRLKKFSIGSNNIAKKCVLVTVRSGSRPNSDVAICSTSGRQGELAITMWSINIGWGKRPANKAPRTPFANHAAILSVHDIDMVGSPRPPLTRRSPLSLFVFIFSATFSPTGGQPVTPVILRRLAFPS